MKKIILLLLVLFISFIYTASSLKVFEIEETEKLSLGIDVEDPDADKLIYTFTEPLDRKGEWQTTYGDAGEYVATIVVSDGENVVSEEVSIIVSRKEEKPVIEKFSPKEDNVEIDEGGKVKFKVTVFDLNEDELSYTWKVNDEIVSSAENMVFETSYKDSGSYTVRFSVSDDVSEVSHEWNVNVNDVDLDSFLAQIEDVTVLETETARLKLPNFRKYGLSYEISEPLQNNKWKTGYGDSGEYDVKVSVFGKDFTGEKTVKIIVQNDDRPPKFVNLKGASVKENEPVVIELEAVDKDDDAVSISVEDIPSNAKLEGNVFRWTPGYDYVQKENVFHYVLDMFRLLRKSVDINFIAQSNALRDERAVRITVKDSNRPFVLESIEDIKVNEGEEIVIDAKYNDPDGDKVSFSYSGFMNRDKKKTGFDDAGSYIVKIVASDSYHTETKFINVKVNDVNRKPEFNMLDNFEVEEGDELRIVLNADDKDNDAVSFSADGLPMGASFKDNLFLWKPDFDVVNGTAKEFNVDFAAFDGADVDSKKVKITVLDMNKAPEIVEFSDNLIAVKNKPILFEVNAVDVDSDSLTYSWDFGFFSKFEGENQHQRIFSSTGSKKVEVTVSDGVESVTKVWDVVVV
mgnify:CR=1 FL=1|tara:strand:- start:8846 stop:10732 length:1887 start_codon:yes stop_codon:yes gene_type:complete